ncbi:unnamed protein product, partial [Adineta ricciae]
MNVVDGAIIDQECASLLKQSDINQLNQFLDVVTIQLTKSSSMTSDYNLINKIVLTLITVDTKQLFKQRQLIQHQLLVILRDYLVKLLFEQDQIALVNNLSIFFHDICSSTLVGNGIDKLMIYTPLVNKICVFFNEIENYARESQQIEIINRLMLIYQNMQMTRLDTRDDSTLEVLFLNISTCFSSKFFLQALQALSTNLPNLNSLLFDTSVEFLYWQPYEDSLSRKNSLFTIYKVLVGTTADLLSSPPPIEPIVRLARLLALLVMVTDGTVDDK